MIEAVLAAAVLAAIGCGFWHIRKKKAQDTRQSYWVETPSLHVSIPATTETNIGRVLAFSLHEVNALLWPELASIYGIEEPRRVIGVVRVVTGEVAEGHSEVVWHTGTNVIRLRVQAGMLWWFALELHNAFRAAAFGYGHIYATMNDDDRNRAIKAQQFIKDTYQA